jgi:hypothetical protein
MGKILAHLLMAGALLAGGVQYFLYLEKNRPPDFLPLYLGGKLALTGRLAQVYDKEAYGPLIEQAMREGARRTKFGNYYFIRPPFQTLYYAPFALFSYPVASALGVLVNLACLGLLVWKLPGWCGMPPAGRAMVQLGLLCFYPFHWAITVGQDTLLLTLLAAYALYALRKGSEGLAGVLLALGCYEPPLVWAMKFSHSFKVMTLAVASLLATAAFAGGAAVLLAISLAAVGPSGLRKWLVLVQEPSSDIRPDIMGNLRALALHFGPAIGFAAAIVVAVALAAALWKGDLYRRVTCAVLAPILLAPHSYWQDYALAAIPAVMTPGLAWRLLLLAPWQFFYTPLDELPMVAVSLAWLIAVTVPRSAGKRPARSPA